MADFDNGLPPVKQSKGKMSSLSIVSSQQTESDYPRIPSVSLTKEVYEGEGRLTELSSVSLLTENYVGARIPAVSIASYTSYGIGTNQGMYL